MNGDLPDSDQIVGVAIGGVVLAAVLVALGLNGHSCEPMVARAASLVQSLGQSRPSSIGTSVRGDGVAEETIAPSVGGPGAASASDTSSGRSRSRPVYVVDGAAVLNIRDAVPRYEGGRRRLGRDVGDLTRGMSVRKLSERAVGDGADVWYEVEVVGGSSAGLRGWVNARYLIEAGR